MSRRIAAEVPRYAELPPDPRLAPWVECYWSIRALDARGAPNRVLPDGCADVILGVEGSPRPLVVGAMRSAAVYAMAGRVDLFGVRFRPGGALPFLGTPLMELTDRRIPLDDIWGAAAARVADGHAVRSLAGRAAHLDGLLVERLRRHEAGRRRDDDLAVRAVALMRRARGSAGVGAVAAALGVGERRLERAFARGVGMSPRTFARVMRFRRVIRALGRGQPRWSALAFEAGYADQAHLIREFRALAGLTPARYVAERRGVGFVQYPEGGIEQIGGKEQAATHLEDDR